MMPDDPTPEVCEGVPRGTKRKPLPTSTWSRVTSCSRDHETTNLAAVTTIVVDPYAALVVTCYVALVWSVSDDAF